MILIRIILFCLLALVLYGIVRVVRGPAGDRKIEHREGGAMVPCAYCALHVPESQAVRDGDQWYCSEEHRRAAREDSQ